MFVTNVNTAACYDYQQMAVVEGFQGHQLRRRDVWCGADQAIGGFKGKGNGAMPPTSSRRGYLVPLEYKKTF